MCGAVVSDSEVEEGVGGFFLWIGGCHDGKSEGGNNKSVCCLRDPSVGEAIFGV